MIRQKEEGSLVATKVIGSLRLTFVWRERSSLAWLSSHAPQRHVSWTTGKICHYLHRLIFNEAKCEPKQTGGLWWAIWRVHYAHALCCSGFLIDTHIWLILYVYVSFTASRPVYMQQIKGLCATYRVIAHSDELSPSSSFPQLHYVILCFGFTGLVHTHHPHPIN